jgi:hypothetical protein
LTDASVTIKNIETGTERKLVTDDAGRYAALSIAVGPYEVQAEKVGFSSQVILVQDRYFPKQPLLISKDLPVLSRS